MEIIIQTKASCNTDPGCKRVNNEDVCYANDNLQCFLVADGVGGNAAGEVASKIFLDTTREAFTALSTEPGKDKSDLIKGCFASAHAEIRQYVDAHPDHKGMGCTAEILSFQDGEAIIGHVGDSRTYLFRAGNLELLTDDHSFVHEQVKAGLIKPEDARKHHLRNLILRAVGVEKDIESDIVSCRVQTGDIFLLCTDGLTDMLEDTEISEVLEDGFSLSDTVNRLIYLANKAGGKDNIAVVLVEIG